MEQEVITICLEGSQVSIPIRRHPRRKYTQLYHHITHKIELRAPLYIPLKTLENFLARKDNRDWILQKLSQDPPTLYPEKDPKPYHQGEYYFQGERFSWDIQDSSSQEIRLDHTNQIATLCTLQPDNPIYNLTLVRRWEVEQSQQLAQKLEQHWWPLVTEQLQQLIQKLEQYCWPLAKAKATAHKPPTIVFKRTKSRWGSYTPKHHRVQLHPDLIKLPPPCFEYVLVHEWCHLFSNKHDSQFYQYLSRFLPSYKKTEELLEQQSLEILGSPYHS